MRSTKVIAFSVPPQFVDHIVKNAKKEHRTISEFIREAIRHYIQYRGGNITAQIKNTPNLLSKRHLQEEATLRYVNEEPIQKKSTKILSSKVKKRKSKLA